MAWTTRDARALLEAALRGPLDEAVRDRIVAESRGNPLALVELPAVADAGRAGGRIRAARHGAAVQPYRAGLLAAAGTAAGPARQLLLTAAAEPVGDVTLLWRAAERLGIGPDAAAAAETAGLIEIAARVRFRHPLVRSAVYRPGVRPGQQDVHARWPR